MSDETEKNAASIPCALKQIGSGSSTLYGLIRRDKAAPRRGKLVILKIEMDKVLEKPTRPARTPKRTPNGLKTIGTD